MTRADHITLAQARAIIEEHELAATRGRYVHTWEKLPSRVVLVTPGRGREAFTLARPLIERLRELTQGEVGIQQIRTQEGTWTPTSVHALEWYLRNITLAGVQRLDPTRRLWPKQAWLKLVALIEPEYQR